MSASSLMGLLAIWAAKSQRHWFVRAAAVACPTALLATVPAFELVLILLAELATVALPLVAWQIWLHRHYRFRLADLLLAVVVVAAGVLLAKNIPQGVRVVGNLATGVACGCAVLAGCGAAMLMHRRWLRAGSVVGLSLVAFATTPFSRSFLWDAPQWLWFAAIPLIAFVVWGCVALHRLIDEASGARCVTARLGLVVLAMTLVPLPVVAYCQMAHPTPIPPFELPSPNAYIELVRIGEDLNKNNPAAFRRQLNDAEQALTYDSLVPVRYAPNDVRFPPHEELRVLLRVWTAAGQAAETDGRYDEACKTYLNIMQAGVKTCRGGLLAEWLLSSLYLQAALDGLQRIRWQLSDRKRREACAVLRISERTLEPMEAALERDQIYAQYAYGWLTRIRFLPIFDFNKEALQRPENRYRAQLRLLEGDLAVRCFQHEHGRLPDQLDELVPDFLPAVPIDPFTEQPLIYRRTESGFLLYCTGPDQIDDGGIRSTSETPEPGQDLLLTVPLYR